VGRSTSRREVRSWKESLFAMAKVLNDPSIPDSCGVGVEYGIPQSSKRIDLLLSGRDETGRGNLLIVELKQWESARRTDMDGLVRTRFAEGEANTSHPSYQSWSYAELLRSFNETVDQDQVPLQPCAQLWASLKKGLNSRVWAREGATPQIGRREFASGPAASIHSPFHHNKRPIPRKRPEISQILTEILPKFTEQS
jgi:hypothetical protein